MPEIPEVFREERRAFKWLKAIWYDIKASKLFTAFRRSRLNPYHTNLKEIKAASYEEAKQKARLTAIAARKRGEPAEVEFLYNGTRCYAERRCPVNQEYEEDGVVLRGRGDVSERIPRNSEGKLDLLAEEPIVISIIPIEGPALVGHVCMQYKDQVVNRLLPSIHTDPLYNKYKKFSEYYFVYPSRLKINPQKIIREMIRHNIKYGDKKYNFITNNCARNVGEVLKRCGVRDLDFIGPDKLGVVFTNPGNNPFNTGIKAWCFKHGVHVHDDEMAEFHRRHDFSSEVADRRAAMKKVRTRYRDYVKNYKDNIYYSR
ncbi:MAG: hypothetical protein IJ689_07205 [Alphaproteobacteria bacterium]|nr:hypothetical protein [Alphaproteobacteria bacterium]